jgi:hypothetical protein
MAMASMILVPSSLNKKPLDALAAAVRVAH